MSRLILFGITLLLSATIFGHANGVTKTPPQKDEQPIQQTQPVVENDQNMVKNLVQDFGKKLQMVSLTASPNTVSKSIRENYGSFLSPALLNKWQSDPKKALGRMVSSPWPDRIEILKMEKTSDSVYKISGEIIEISSTEKTEGGIAAKQPVTLTVKKINNRWLIDEAATGPYAAPQGVIYTNTQYGFNFPLPDSWQGYTIVKDQWAGTASGDVRTVETGPLISIRHPQWTSQNPRQDIPIMVFTLSQWDSLQQDKFHIGAAPVNPSELGRNNKYVFALPARYNFAFPTGYEEVEEILKGKPLQPFTISD